MVHDQQAPANSYQARQDSRGRFLILAGALWLLLASILLIYLLLYEGRVELSWETATEQNTAGFNVYRSDKADEGFTLVNTERLIDSQGSPTSGASYTFIDDQVTAGETYYYVLEEVELNGSQRLYTEEVFAYSVPGRPWGAAFFALVSVIVGTWMFARGIKERKRQ